MVRELGFLEDKRLLRDFAQSYEVEQRPEQLAPSGQVHPGVVLLAPYERSGVYSMDLGEALLSEVAPQVPNLLGDVDTLVVEEQGNDVVGGMGLVGPEIARLVDEDAQLGHRFLLWIQKMAGKTSPPLGGPGPFGQPRI